MVYKDIVELTIKTDTNTFLINKIIEMNHEWSIDKYTSTCSFKIPLNTFFVDTNNITFKLFDNKSSLFLKKLDKVSLSVGYETENNELKTEIFNGVISQIELDYDNKYAIISCEDYMYLLKSLRFTFVADKVDLSFICQKFVDELNIQYSEKFGEFTFSSNFKLNMEKFTVSNVTGLDILKKLNQKYKINAFIKNNEIIFGTNLNNDFIHNKINSYVQKYYYTNNDIDFLSNVKRKKEYKRDRVNYCHILGGTLIQKLYNENSNSLTVNCIDSNNNFKTKTFGNKSSKNETILLYRDDIGDIAEVAKSYFQSINYQGFAEGSYIKTFAYPYIQLHDVITVDLYALDNDYDSINISDTVAYFVTRNLTTYSNENGLKSELYLKYAYKTEEYKELDVITRDELIDNVKSLFKLTFDSNIILKEENVRINPDIDPSLTSDQPKIDFAEPIQKIKKEEKVENEIVKDEYFNDVDVQNMADYISRINETTISIKRNIKNIYDEYYKIEEKNNIIEKKFRNNTIDGSGSLKFVINDVEHTFFEYENILNYIKIKDYNKNKIIEFASLLNLINFYSKNFNKLLKSKKFDFEKIKDGNKEIVFLSNDNIKTRKTFSEKVIASALNDIKINNRILKLTIDDYYFSKIQELKDKLLESQKIN